MPSTRRHIIPIAICIAVILIAGAIYTTFGHRPKSPTQKASEDVSVSIRPIDATDHLLGNPNAPVILVEYSDLECPYCKRFHATLQKIMDEYGKDGRIGWVFRHFPIVQLHSKAPTEALATECAATQGGNAAFWAMTNMIFAETPGNNGLDLAKLPVFAQKIGLERAPFEQCLLTKDMARIDRDFQDAKDAGGQGTPFTVFIVGDKKIPLVGARPYVEMKALIEAVLAQAASAQGAAENNLQSPSTGAEPYQKNGGSVGTSSVQ